MAPERSQALDHGAWRLAAVPAGAPEPAPDSPAWQCLAERAPVAAALRALGHDLLAPGAKRLDAQDWWYELHFDADQALDDPHAQLCFDGLATQAQAWLNGEPLLTAANQFRHWRCDVAGRLLRLGNRLLLRFASMDAALTQRRPRPRWKAPMVEHQQLRWWRSSLLGRVPGWCPPLPPIGPWAPVRLEWGTGWEMEVQHTQVELAADGSGHITVLAKLPDEAAELLLHHEGEVFSALFEGQPNGLRRAQLQVPQCLPWWPHTHGKPALHALAVRQGERVHELGRVGFRRLQAITQDGGFGLEVNGQRVFCRGAVWTPVDVMQPDAPAQAVREAVQRCVRAGMNMLRVPGTGWYENEHFLQACSEAGVLVWQDFMFANLDYPADDAGFIAEVEVEVQQQMQRWQTHPCMAVLCGNSEVEQQAAMFGAERALWRPRLFHEQLPAWCATQLPGVPYWPSSAHGGAFAHQADAGTCSYYGVGAYLRDLGDARRAAPRFATECLAFANVPGDAALQRMPGGMGLQVHHPQWKARSPRDLGAGWDFDDVRDHYLTRLFGVDALRLRYEDAGRYLALSRVASAVAMHESFVEWRRADSACNGALVLMARDLWAGAGWGLEDELGTPKPAWHVLAQAWQPLHLGLTDEGGNGLALHLVNEGAQPVRAQLELAAWREGGVCLWQHQQACELGPRSQRSQGVMEALPHFNDLTHAYRFGPLRHQAVSAVLRGAQGQWLAQALYLPGGWPAAQQADVGLAATATQLADSSFELQLSARELALFVQLELPQWHSSAQYIHLLPGQPRMLRLQRRAGCTERAPTGLVHALNARAELRL